VNACVIIVPGKASHTNLLSILYTVHVYNNYPSLVAILLRPDPPGDPNGSTSPS
jgi:hypothetical protein